MLRPAPWAAAPPAVAVHGVQHVGGVGLWGEVDVCAQQRDAGGQAPDVQVVHLLHPRHLLRPGGRGSQRKKEGGYQ